MGHIGIIAEYNPLHNGHAYQIDCVKKAFPDKEVVIILSGNYVQRGEPAIFNKYIRTEMALSSGADMVIELPGIYACSSAEFFARASVLSLWNTGIVDTICFGAEWDNLTDLSSIAQILENEPPAYKQILKSLLAQGQSFPKARSNALSRYMNNNTMNDILCRPNNILAIEYLKAIEHFHLNMKPYLITRTSDNYHDTVLPISTDRSKDSAFISSATAIRSAIKASNTAESFKPYMPSAAYEILQQSDNNLPVFYEDFYPLIQSHIQIKKSSIDRYMDVTSDFANRLQNYDILPFDMNRLIDALCSKNITKTRVFRILFHILLDYKKENYRPLLSENDIPYLRILGFRKESVLPKQLKQNGKIPVLTKVADYKKVLLPENYSFFETQIKADNYYRQVYYNKYHRMPSSEFEHSVIFYK